MFTYYCYFKCKMVILHMFNVVFPFLCCIFWEKFFPLMWTPYGASKAPFY
ncbi:unnamed protein product [Brassica rapa]|uniref:Uncharacterized protein n=1 Tax=Brassica campestris TaxID=3711 RepID=A0A8D9M7N5_BRACM|nr:unnamed protein product [Brassica rapa]